MENATKALLIAASVLITIVVIALGIKILTSGFDTSKQASQVQNAISESTNDAANSAIVSMKKINQISVEKFNKEYKQYVTKENDRNFWGITSEDFFRLLEMNNQKNGEGRSVTVGGPGYDYFRDTNYLYYFLPRYDEDGYLYYLSYNGRELIN